MSYNHSMHMKTLPWAVSSMLLRHMQVLCSFINIYIHTHKMGRAQNEDIYVIFSTSPSFVFPYILNFHFKLQNNVKLRF